MKVDDGGSVFTGPLADLLGIQIQFRPIRSNATAVSIGLRSSR